ncbi:MAG: glycosyltransferase [Candidatus Binatia bacterium]
MASTAIQTRTACEGAPGTAASSPELTVLIPVLNERDNLAALLPRLARVLATLGCASEVLVVDGGSRDGTAEVARGLGARLLQQQAPGYGGALREGFAAAAGRYVLTLDADLSHDPDFIGKLWRTRGSADVTIASRYVRGGAAYMPWHRKLLSKVLNRFFASGLSLPVRDLSSGFRLYNARVLRNMDLTGRNFDILEEVLVKAYAEGWRIAEIPFTYYPRDRGASHARIVRFGLDLLRAFARLWALRNSIESADYDERAFYSLIPLQRYWQRRRHRVITTMARGAGRVLDVGAGSSVILQTLNYAVGLDIRLNKLRYMRQYGVPLVQGSLMALPVRAASFDCVVCSQVIEHIPADPAIFPELVRVLRPGGLLILGTPDYDTIGWRTIEPLYGIFAPGGYKDEHITHYTLASLTELAARHGLQIVDQAYVFGSELILAMRKKETTD